MTWRPDETNTISWIFPSKSSKDVYRGSTQVAAVNHMGLKIFDPSPMVKNADTQSTTATNSHSFTTVKAQPPVLEIYDPVSLNQNADVAVQAQAQQVKQAQPEQATVYDYFQPMLAHYSQTKTPTEMKLSVEKTLNQLVQAGIVDFYAEAPFIFAGRGYGEYGDCEFRITIFSSDDDHKSVTEIRRSCGEAFTFANAERQILFYLRKDGAIEQVDSSSDTSDTGLAPFTFGMLPDYKGMEFELPDDLPDYGLGMNIQYSNDELSVTEILDEQKDEDVNAGLSIPAINLERAISSATLQAENRLHVVALKNEIERYPVAYKDVNDITTKLVASIDHKNFDAFATRTILQSLLRLIKADAPLPDGFSNNIKSVYERWQQVVENKISEQLSFQFAPSQQVMKECDEILKLLKDEK